MAFPLLMKQFTLVVLLIVATFTDLEHWIIPNRLVVYGLFAGTFFLVVSAQPALYSALLGMVLVGGILLVLGMVSKGGMGGGDIKLGLLIGLFLGWPEALLALFLAAFTGSIYGLLLRSSNRLQPGEPIPFAPFIALGTIISMLFGPEMLEIYYQCWLF